MNIDRITGLASAKDHTNDAGLFAACAADASLRNLRLSAPMIKGRRRVGALCGYAANAVISYVHVEGGAIQGDSASAFTLNIGGLVGRALASRIIGSSAGANVSGGGSGGDHMGGLVGHLDSTYIIASRASANVAGGGSGGDRMGGLVGYLDSAYIIASRASGNVSDGGDSIDNMGGLVGYLVGDPENSAYIIAGRASGNVSDGGAGGDSMGSLIGEMINNIIVRDSLGSGAVCDGALMDTSCAAGAGNDFIGILVAYAEGYRLTNQKNEFYNCLARGLTRGESSDRIGFFGTIEHGSETNLNASIANNRLDTQASGVTTIVAAPPSGVSASNLTGIVGADTAETQSATAYDSTWLATRWLFAEDSYPRLLYFNYDPANPTMENPSSETTIVVCETITNNDPLEDQGDALKPDCGDVLDAWPRGE